MKMSFHKNGESSRYVSGPGSPRMPGRQLRKNEDRVALELGLSRLADGLCLANVELRPGNW